MVFSTQEHVAHLVAAGSSPFLRIWNIQNETCIGVLPTGSDASSVTCLASSSNGNLLAAGFGNGIVHLYDCRQRYSQICALMKHTSSVLNESALHLPHCSLSEYRRCQTLFHSILPICRCILFVGCQWLCAGLDPRCHAAGSSVSRQRGFIAHHH